MRYRACGIGHVLCAMAYTPCVRGVMVVSIVSAEGEVCIAYTSVLVNA